MKLYHIDKYGLLSPGQTIELQSINVPCKIADFFPDGLSAYGNNITGLMHFPSSIVDPNISTVVNWMQLTAFNYELIFELVRQKNFTHLPSRFQSFFATDEKNLDHWLKRLNGIDNPPIYEIFFNHNNYCKLDESFLVGGLGIYNSARNINDGPYYYSMEAYLSNAWAYWSGESSSEPHWEYLIVPPLNVGCRIR